MTYFVGDRLDEKIKQFRLEEIEGLVQDFSLGRLEWAGPVYLTPPEPQFVEPLRIVLYSLLNRYTVKPQFQVKLIGDTLTLDLKMVRRKGGSKAEMGVINTGISYGESRLAPSTPTAAVVEVETEEDRIPDFTDD